MKLTQFVLLFSFSSLFGIKVPDRDGIAAGHKTVKIILINLRQQLISFVSQVVLSKSIFVSLSH